MAINLEVYPNPDPISFSLSSNLYSVSAYDGINYLNCHVYKATAKAWTNPTQDNYTSLWTSGSYPTMNYCSFGMDDSTYIKIEKIGTSITSIDIGPYSKQKNEQVELVNGKAIIPVNKNDKLWVTINNIASSPLFIFCDPPIPSYAELSSSYPLEEGWSHIHYTSGIHYISSLPGNLDSEGFGNRVILNSKTFVYFDPGSYIKGHFNISGCNDIKIIGKGVLSLEHYNSFWWEYFSNLSYTEKVQGTVFFSTDPNTPNSYLDWRLSGNGLSGLTIVNFPFYLCGPGSIQYIDNVKTISPWFYSTDGFRIFNFYNKEEGAFLINSFMFNCDDLIFPGISQSQGNCLVSSCYLCTHSNSIFANYFVNFNASLTGIDKYYFSAIDIDIRSYTGGEGGDTAIFKLLSDTTQSTITTAYAGVLNSYFKNINIENRIGNRLFMLGNIKYPYYFENPGSTYYQLGNTSGIQFENINVSSFVGSTWNTSDCLIYGKDSLNEVKNILFKNVTIDGVKLTESNKNTYFIFSGSTDTANDNITFISDFPSTLKVSPIKLLN